jgi:CRP-like cAMP-binding protein
MSKIVITFLQTKGLRSKELKEHLYKILRKEIIIKKGTLLKINDVCERVWFIEKGLFRGYTIFKGIQKNEFFMTAGDVMFAPLSVYTGDPSELGIEALEDCIVYSISIRQLELIYAKYPEFNLIGRKLTEKYYMMSLQNAALLRHYNIKPRYLGFLKLYPHFDKPVPAVHIASFLGCSEEAFIRMRKRYKKQLASQAKEN